MLNDKSMSRGLLASTKTRVTRFGYALSACIMSFAILPHSANAKFIVLNVPVSVSKLPPDVTAAFLTCSLKNQEGREMADTSVRIPLVNGGYEGLVRARFIPGG